MPSDNLTRRERLVQGVLTKLGPRLAEGASDHVMHRLRGRPAGYDPHDDLAETVDYLFGPTAKHLYHPGKAPDANDPDTFRSVLALLPLAPGSADQLAGRWRVELGRPGIGANGEPIYPGPGALAKLAMTKLGQPENVAHRSEKPPLSYGARQVRAVLEAVPEVSRYKISDTLCEEWSRELGGRGPVALARSVANRLADPWIASGLTTDGQPAKVDVGNPVFSRGPELEGHAEAVEAARPRVAGF